MGKSKKVWNGIMLMMTMLFMLCMKADVEAATLSEATRKFTPETAFTIDKTSGLITGYTDADANNPLTEIVIPTKIDGVDVEGLSGTFCGNTSIETVIIPDTVTTIGDDSFNGCTSFNNLAFYTPEDGISLDMEVEEDQLNEYICDGTTAYKVLNLEWGVAAIPDSVDSIGRQAFGGKTGIAKFVVMENNSTYLTTEDGVCLLSAVTQENGQQATNLVRFASGYTCNNGYTLPDSLISIGSYAFEDIHNDGHLIFPASLQVISDYGFYKYGMIDNNFDFPEDCALHTIGSYAFTYNRKLQIKFSKNVKTIGSYFCSYNENVAIDISETQIETIPEYAFADCSALHEITMPATVKHILAYAFTNCNNLSTVTFLGDELLTLGEGAFKDSPTLHYITIPEGVTEIENETFSGCQNLGEVILPDSVTTIGDEAFKDCVTIHTLVIPPNVNYISNTSFDGVDQTKIDTSKNEYSQTIIKGELPKKGYKKVIGNVKYKVTKSSKTKGTVSVIGAKNKKQKSITIPSTVNINGYTFKVTAIADKAFKKNTKLATVTIGSNVKTVGKEAFRDCKKLKKITVKSKVVSKVGKNAFKNIKKNATIKLPKMTKKKFNKYKKKFMNKGQAKTVKIKK